ncbi:MAG: hypothetical protein Q4C77_16240 [Eubacteriales bacterium]|nr:hypothetical protein [Eubacteriales bacterium]
MGKRRKNKGQNRKRKNNQFCEGNYTRENDVQTSEDDSLEEMDELLEQVGLDIKYTGTGK